MVVWSHIFVKRKKQLFGEMFIVQILLGQSTNEINYVRVITGAWVLTGMFLSYNYQGNNIDQLTSPFELKKFETFEQILSNNLTVYSLPIQYEELQLLLADPNMGVIEYYDTWKGLWTVNELKFGKMYYHQKIKQTEESLRAILKPIVKIPTDFEEMKTMAEFEYYVNVISKCGKVAFADVFSFVEKLRSKLHVDKRQISQSKVAFGQMHQLWWFYKLQLTAKDYARRRFGIIEFGLVHIWNEWKYHLELWNDTVQAAKQDSSTAKPLSLKGNLVVVFYVDLTLKTACLIVVALECAGY